jgi:membrane protein DedA with SNARE-associated domain
MKNKSLFWAIIALFLGWSTYKQFDFEAFRFKTPVAYLYIVTCLVAALFYLKSDKNQ